MTSYEFESKILKNNYKEYLVSGAAAPAGGSPHGNSIEK
jgi:hypothetical protein